MEGGRKDAKGEREKEGEKWRSELVKLNWCIFEEMHHFVGYGGSVKWCGGVVLHGFVTVLRGHSMLYWLTREGPQAELSTSIDDLTATCSGSVD